MLTDQNYAAVEAALTEGTMPTDSRSIVIDYNVLKQNEDMGVGSTVEISLGEEQPSVSVTISGLYAPAKVYSGHGRMHLDGATLFAPEALFHELHPEITSFDYSWSIVNDAKKTDYVGAELKNIVASHSNIALDEINTVIEYEEMTNSFAFGSMEILSWLVFLFGVINLINTTLSNQIARKQENSILRSIGLTQKQLSALDFLCSKIKTKIQKSHQRKEMFYFMKTITKVLSLILALTLLLSFPVAASAAELTNMPTIDESKTGSLTIYKYDLTNAEKDGVWDSSYVSTGVYDEAGVNNVLGGSTSSTLGNGETGYGYAITGVEFTYAKVADIFQYGETETTDGHVEILYAVDKAKGADFLKALGLADGKNRYEKADALDETKYFYQSDVLISALSSGLTANSTTVKNTMERYAAANGAAMPLTDSYGKTKAENLPLGLYLVAETKVPEMVVSTTDPFLVSVPMTSVNGTNANDGGTRWSYDITLYPKNLTGIPSLEKTLRESKNDTGKTDAYSHTGTASAGDTIDYQIISTLPSITSEATHLSCYTFIDTMSAGLTYIKGDVTLEIFSDAACKNAVTTWKEADGYFTVSYNDVQDGKTAMTVEMTAMGLAEINNSQAVYADASMPRRTHSRCICGIWDYLSVCWRTAPNTTFFKAISMATRALSLRT